MRISSQRRTPSIRLPDCPRCQGHLFLRDFNRKAKPEEGRAEIACLQCGHVVPQPDADQLLKDAVRRAAAA